MSKAARDKIRAATVGAKKRYSSVLVDLSKDIKVEVRQLSLEARKDYTTAAIDIKTKTACMLKLQVHAIIASCYVPGTDEKVYDDTDYPAIAQSVSGGYADNLWEAIQEMSNLTVKDAKKN